MGGRKQMNETRKEWLDKIIDLHEKINGAKFDDNLCLIENKNKTIQLKKGIFLLAKECGFSCKVTSITQDEWYVEFNYRECRIFQFIKGDVIENV